MNEMSDLFERLESKDATLTQTMATVDALEARAPLERTITLGISSNVSVDLLSVFLRKHGLLNGTRVRVTTGNHDDALGDVEDFVAADLDGMVFLSFFDNLLPAFELQIAHLTADQIDAKLADVRARLRLMLDKASSLAQVFVCTFHRFTEGLDTGAEDPVRVVLAQYNQMIREECEAFPNTRIIDTSAIVETIGTAASFDHRFYLRNTAPYKTTFLDELARRISLASRGFGSHFYKAVVLDCDNTLWGGIIGEDLLGGIKLDPHAYPGRIFWRAQQEFAALERNGILLCLCSKNNAADVDEVLAAHPHAVLKDDHITVKKVDWTDKVSNLKALATELNIGLDSIIFVDDSDFECAAVKASLPSVKVFQVPKALADYPRVIRQITELCLGGGVSKESRSKTAQYRQRQMAAAASAEFASHEEYLESLDLRVDVRLNDTANLPRTSELTLKSNQFNLTTLRLTVGELSAMIKAGTHGVYTLTVHDRFGSAGLTGVAVIHWDGEVARVDAFLMSCRVIGRGVELSFWSRVAEDARRRGCRVLEASFKPSAKNMQVADFYDRLGMPLVSTTNAASKTYRTPIDDFTPPTTHWIKLNHDE